MWWMRSYHWFRLWRGHNLSSTTHICSTMGRLVKSRNPNGISLKIISINCRPFCQATMYQHDTRIITIWSKDNDEYCHLFHSVQHLPISSLGLTEQICDWVPQVKFCVFVGYSTSIKPGKSCARDMERIFINRLALFRYNVSSCYMQYCHNWHFVYRGYYGQRYGKLMTRAAVFHKRNFNSFWWWIYELHVSSSDKSHTFVYYLRIYIQLPWLITITQGVSNIVLGRCISVQGTVNLLPPKVISKRYCALS